MEEKKLKMDDIIREINELYHKSQKEGLSPAEKERQTYLRNLYIASVRMNLVSQLDNIEIQNEDGTITSLKDKKHEKRS